MLVPKVNRISALIAVLVIASCSAQMLERFNIPSSYEISESTLPVSYLENYPIDDPKEKLTREDKQALACLLIDAEEVSVKLYEHSYMIPANAPIIVLFLTNFESFRSQNWEGKSTPSGGVILLGYIRDFLIERVTCNGA